MSEAELHVLTGRLVGSGLQSRSRTRGADFELFGGIHYVELASR